MARYHITTPAEKDVLGIWLYIARDSLAAADRMVDRFTEAYELLAKNPDIGQKLDQYRPGLQAWSVGNYLVYFRGTSGSGLHFTLLACIPGIPDTMKKPGAPRRVRGWLRQPQVV